MARPLPLSCREGVSLGEITSRDDEDAAIRIDESMSICSLAMGERMLIYESYAMLPVLSRILIRGVALSDKRKGVV